MNVYETALTIYETTPGGGIPTLPISEIGPAVKREVPNPPYSQFREFVETTIVEFLDSGMSAAQIRAARKDYVCVPCKYAKKSMHQPRCPGCTNLMALEN